MGYKLTIKNALGCCANGLGLPNSRTLVCIIPLSPVSACKSR